DRALNNGQPSFIAFLISLGEIQPGEHVAHIGAGVGYYTGVIAHLVKPGSTVTAIEYEPSLAARAAKNLASDPAVRVIAGDGTTVPFDPADVIFVNAGATHPPDHWLDRLNDGGRLILPLTTSFTTPDGHPMTRGAIFLIQRKGADFLVQWKSST